MAFKRVNSVYFMADSKEDLKNLPEMPMGAECYVISEACEYKVNSKGEWIIQRAGSVAPGSVEVDLTGYATEKYVDEKVNAIEIPSVDDLATEAYVDNAVKSIKVPSLEGFATEEFVMGAIAEVNPVKDVYGDAHAFGLMVDSKENKTLVQAMLEKGKVGMYNFHIEKGCPGQPEEVVAKNSSCRGVCCVDTYRSDSNWYGWILMFDQDGDTYVQYIRNAVPQGWKKIVNKEQLLEKYEFKELPERTIIDHRDKEIRILCPADSVYHKQNVGAEGSPNMYYMTFTSYAPEGAVYLKEGDKGVIVDEKIPLKGGSGTGIDKFGRAYKNHWFALAMYDEEDDTWTYFGNNSNADKYIGWTYCVEWYDENDKMIDCDMIRINLSNENCHMNLKPYLG